MLPPNPFTISAEHAKTLEALVELDTSGLLRAMALVARDHARAAISGYTVGAAAMGQDGAIYLGVNLEFPGTELNQTVHAEQFAWTVARHHGERHLTMLAVSAPPCGHCRQWLLEMAAGWPGSGDRPLRVLIPGHPPYSMEELLPASFGGDALVLGAPLAPPSHGLQLMDDRHDAELAKRRAGHETPGEGTDPELETAALEAAGASYSPYTHSPAGVALRMSDGSIYRGSYVENAAFNPSLPPLQAAIINAVADGHGPDEISTAVLVEKRGARVSLAATTRALLKAIQPNATLHVLLA